MEGQRESKEGRRRGTIAECLKIPRWIVERIVLLKVEKIEQLRQTYREREI